MSIVNIKIVIKGTISKHRDSLKLTSKLSYFNKFEDTYIIVLHICTFIQIY